MATSPVILHMLQIPMTVAVKLTPKMWIVDYDLINIAIVSYIIVFISVNYVCAYNTFTPQIKDSYMIAWAQ